MRSHTQEFSSSTQSFGINLMIAFSVVVTILGDQMPWFSGFFNSMKKGNFLRSVLLATTAVIAVALTIFSLIKLKSFGLWLAQIWPIAFSQISLTALLYSILIGWTMIAIGSCRHILLFALSLPTVTLLAFATSWSGPNLAAAMAILVSLAVASADRRLEQRIIGSNGQVTMLLFGNPP